MSKKRLATILLLIVTVVFFGSFNILKAEDTLAVRGLLSPDTKLGRLATNLWLPKSTDETFGSWETVDRQLHSEAAYFVDVDSGEVLYQKNEHKKLPIASLVKVMTAIVALENKQLEDEFIISSKAAQMEPDKMLLIAGETLTLKELLSGIFLVSANDAAEVLAERIFDSRERFLEVMNEKANLLAMLNTNFVNPTGLDEDEQKQFSTAYDVALMSRYLIKNYPQVVTDISSQEHIYLNRTENHQDYDLYSGINLLTTYPGVIGLKTGYTPEAGLTLITLCKKGERLVLGVLLSSSSRREDAKLLLDYSFKKLGIETN